MCTVQSLVPCIVYIMIILRIIGDLMEVCGNKVLAGFANLMLAAMPVLSCSKSERAKNLESE